MTARSLLALAAAVALAAAPAPSAAQSRTKGAKAPAKALAKADLLDRAVAAWAKVKTARATFEQTINNPLTGGTLRASGEYQQQRPGKLSVKFDDPAADRIVSDGRYVWLYLPSTTPGQVIRSDLRTGGTGTLDLSAQFLTEPRSRFTVTEAGALTVAGRATHGYLLVPKAKAGAPFARAVVQIDDADATVRQFTTTETNGVERMVRLTAFRTNVPVQASAFVFTPPPGTRIVER